VNTSETVKKAQQRLHFLRVLRKNNLECKLIVAAPLSKVYSPTASRRGTPVAPQQTREPSKGSSTQHKKSLAAHCPPWNPLPAPATFGRANNILKHYSRPGHHLFTLLPSGRRYRSFRARTTRPKNSFFPMANRTLNTDMH